MERGSRSKRRARIKVPTGEVRKDKTQHREEEEQGEEREREREREAPRSHRVHSQGSRTSSMPPREQKDGGFSTGRRISSKK